MAADKVVRVEIRGGADSFVKAVVGASKATHDLDKGVKDLGGSIESTFKGAASNVGPLGSALGAVGPAGLAAAAGIGAAAAAVGTLVGFLVDATKSLVEFAGHLSDLADKTGLSTTTLQELKFAGSLVGVSMEDAADAVNKLQKNIVAGSTVFERLGLDLDKLRAQDTAGQFDTVAAAIRGISDPAQQTAAAIEAFGKSGANVLPLIKSDMAAAREEAHRLGIVIGEETVAAADDLGDKATKLGAAWEAVGHQFASALIDTGLLQDGVDVLTKSVGTLATFVSENKGLIQALFEGAAGFATTAVTLVEQLTDRLKSMALVLGGPIALGFAVLGKNAAAEIQETVRQINLGMKAIEDGRKAARAGAALGGPANTKTFVSQEDLDKAAKLAAEIDKLAEAERQAAIEATKRAAAEDAAVAKHNAEVQKRISSAQESVFGTSPAAAAEALASFNILTKALGAEIEVVHKGKLAYNGLGEAISKLSQGKLTALEAQLVKLEKESRDDVDTNNDIATTLGLVRKQLRATGEGFAEAARQIHDTTSTTEDWVQALDAALEALGALGNTSLGNLVNELGRVLKASKAIRDQIGKAGGFSKLNTAGKFEVGAGIAGAAFGIGADAFRGASTNAGKSVAKGALGGAAKGALAGSVVPVIGTAVGAVVGGVIGGVAGFFGSKKKTRELLKSFDEQLIQQFGSIQKAEQIAKKYGIALDKALDSKKPEKITKAINDLNAALEKRANLEQGLQTANENAQQLQDLTKGIDNPKLQAAVQALAQKVSDEMLKAGLGFQATGALRESEGFKQAQSVSAATAGTVGGLRQAGVVDQGVLAAAGTIASETQKAAFEAAKAAGLDDAAATKASFGAVSDLLREQLNASIASGRELDANTKALIEEAKANGIDIIADPTIAILDENKQQTALLREIAGKGAAGNGRGNSAGPSKDNIPGFAGGGVFRAPASGGLFVGHGLEAVVPIGGPNMPTPTADLAGGSFRGFNDILEHGFAGPKPTVNSSPVFNVNVAGLSKEEAISVVAAAIRQGNVELSRELDRKYGR